MPSRQEPGTTAGSPAARPTRSWLFVPARRVGWAARAMESGADCLILDLEDSVPAGAKEIARDEVCELIEAVREHAGQPAEAPRIFVRMNGLASRWWLDDLRHLLTSAPPIDGIVVPEVRSEHDVVTVDRVVSTLGAGPEVELHPIFENADGVARCTEILTASPRIRSFFGGAAPNADLNFAIGFRWTESRRETLYLRSRLLLAGRSAGVPNAVGGTWLDVEDVDGLLDYAHETRALGFDGMYAIHPDHIPHINEVFQPSAAEREWATAVLAALDDAEGQGQAATVVDGAMVDEATRGRALQILAGEGHGSNATD